jgi:predicted exporter
VGPWRLLAWRGWRPAVVLLTVVCAWLTASRLRVSSDLSALLPEAGDAWALARWTRGAGGHEPALVLLRGKDPAEVARAADDLAGELRRAPSIARVIDRAPVHQEPEAATAATLAWIYAGPEARTRLAAAVTPAGMRARLEETRALLLAPATDPDQLAWLARDPLRLAQLPWLSIEELAAGVRASPGGPFVADEGRARLVVAQPTGSAFTSESARAVVADVERAMDGAARPGVTMELSGGHAIAQATERMLKRDLAVSGTLSIVLAAAAFVATFRRARALLAVLPPLVLGTLWTTGLAALLPGGLRAVAIAFAAVVVGVGVDTGVHVYAALLDARRAGAMGRAAAQAARAATWRPTLTAAAVAAIGFASLGLSGLRAMRELGLLCGAGEMLTAIAILLVTPEVGAWIERGSPPPEVTPRWTEWLARATATRPRAIAALVVCVAPIAIVAAIGWPKPASAVVAIRPPTLAPLVAEGHVRALFGGRPGQWLVLCIDAVEEAARARADRVGEALEPLARAGVIDGFDALATFAPSTTTMRARLAERDALGLPSRRGDLQKALREAGFDLDACAAGIDAFAHPSSRLPDPISPDSEAVSWFVRRHIVHDAGDTLVATYVRPGGDPAADERLRAAIARADPRAIITGFDAMDRGLRDALSHDMLLVGAVTLVVVGIAMRLVLRSVRHALVALSTLACELGAVGLAMRVLAVKWHVYDALVLPVLFGVTIDESMFLLYSARAGSMRDALRTQGPLVAATALTTAAGFLALVACRFPGLSDLGAVGTIGVLAGLVAALVVVPSAFRALGPRGEE